MEQPPRFFDQFREDPALLLGPLLVLAPLLVLVWLASVVGG